MNIKYIYSLFFFLLSTLSLNSVFPAEFIKHFRSEIDVQTDGKIVVAEKITVNCQQVNIRRGIIRNIPTKRTVHPGKTDSISINVLDVYRNGKQEPFKVFERNREIEIHIGSALDFLEKGEQTFDIVYVADRVIRSFDDYDELYWNVTGNFWDYPIQYAEAWVTLPQAAEVMKTTAYTGKFGQRKNNYSARHQVNTAFFQTKSALEKKEGLTICVAWPKGHVTPYISKELIPFVPNSYSYIFIAFPWLITVVITTFLYLKFRRKRSNKISQTPPCDLSPPEASYLYHMEFKEEVLISMLIDLHFKRYITISKKDDGDYLISRTNTNTQELSNSERFVLSKMFKKDPEFVINKSNQKELRSILRWLKKDLKKRHRHRFTNISRWKRACEKCLFLFFTPMVLSYEATNPFLLPYLLGCVAYLWLSQRWSFKKPKKQYEPLYETIDSFQNFLEKLNTNPRKIIEKSRYKVTAEDLKKYIPYMVGFKIIDDWDMGLLSGFKNKLSKGQAPATSYYRGFGVIYPGFNHSFSNGCTRSGFSGGGSGFGGGGFSGGGFGGGGGGGR